MHPWRNDDGCLEFWIFFSRTPKSFQCFLQPLPSNHHLNHLSKAAYNIISSFSSKHLVEWKSRCRARSFSGTLCAEKNLWKGHTVLDKNTIELVCYVLRNSLYRTIAISYSTMLYCKQCAVLWYPRGHYIVTNAAISYHVMQYCQ